MIFPLLFFSVELSGKSGQSKVTPKVSMASTQCLTLAFEAKYQCGT